MNFLKTGSLLTSIIFLTHCGSDGREVERKSNGEYQADHGPFDSRGNYIEGWADNPPKRSYRRSSSSARKSKKSRSTSRTKKSSATSRKSKSHNTSRRKSSSNRTTSNRTTKSTRKRTKPSTSRKSKPKKITPRSKPPVMHTVRKGDTVYGLARKYKADPAAIIKANRIKNGRINIGQRLVIPRK